MDTIIQKYTFQAGGQTLGVARQITPNGPKTTWAVYEDKDLSDGDRAKLHDTNPLDNKLQITKGDNYRVFALVADGLGEKCQPLRSMLQALNPDGYFGPKRFPHLIIGFEFTDNASPGSVILQAPEFTFYGNSPGSPPEFLGANKPYKYYATLSQAAALDVSKVRAVNGSMERDGEELKKCWELMLRARNCLQLDSLGQGSMIITLSGQQIQRSPRPPSAQRGWNGGSGVIEVM